MTITYQENLVTLFDVRNGYSFASTVPFVDDVKTVCEALTSWCATRMVDGETISNVVIEKPEYISAAVTVSCNQGSRTFVVAQSELPDQLSQSLSIAWESLK
jgi:hypothetical protein